MPEARDHRQVAHLQHVARPGALDLDRPGHDVDAGIAVVLGDVAIELADRVVHHQVGRVAGMMRDRLDMDVIAALHLQRGREGGVEIAPVNRFLRGPQDMEHRSSLSFVRDRVPSKNRTTSSSSGPRASRSLMIMSERDARGPEEHDLIIVFAGTAPLRGAHLMIMSATEWRGPSDEAHGGGALSGSTARMT